jgi:trigger factor
VVDERGIRPATTPKVDIESQDEDGDLAYSIELEILPDITPMDFSKLELSRLKVTVSDTEVDEALGRFSESRKETKPLETPRPAESGDVLVLDFAGTVDGEAKPGMADEDHQLHLGSNSFIEGFEDQLIGVEVGEERTVTVTFPDEYVNDELSGREAVFVCTIKDILASEVPELSDEFAVSIGEENLETLKEKIREQIGTEYQRLARERTKREMLDKLSENHEFPVPETMAKAEFDAIWRQIESDKERGVTDPEDEGKSEDELRGEYEAIANRRVRLGLLLAEVGRLNEIEVTQDEVNTALSREVSRYPGQEQQVVQFYQNNPQALAQIRAPLFEEKVVDFIAELASVSEREITADDLKAEEEQSAEAEEAPKKKATKKSPAKKNPAKKTGKAKKAAASEGEDAKEAE